MSLQNLEKDLQKKDPVSVKRKHNKTVYDVWEAEEPPKEKRSNWQKIRDKMFPTRMRAIVFGGGLMAIVIALLVLTISIAYLQRTFFAQERVTLTMEAPRSIDSNMLTEVVFTYTNDNRAYLDDARIIVQFGDYFVPEDGQENFTRVSDDQGVITIGKIEGKETNSIAIAGRFIGPKNAVDDVAGTLRYVPERTNVRFETNARATTTILSSPLMIDVKAPTEVVSGNLMNIAVVIKNTSANDFSHLKLTMDMPETFSLVDAQPRPVQGGKVWLIDNVLSQSEKIINIRGSINAPIGTAQKFFMELGTQKSGAEYVTYAKESYTPQIINSPIIIRQEIRGNTDNVVYAGENLRFDVTATNNSDIPLRKAIVAVKFDTRVLDFSKLKLIDGGDYDAQEHKITWKASDVPALKVLNPGESVKISFIIPVMNKLPIETKNDHHFNITSLALIDSEDIPSELRENKTVLSNVLTVPVGAKVIFDSSATHKEGTQPLKVGEKTVYTITFSIDSINNDITNTVVHAPLPTYIQFESGDDTIVYNERTNEITWNVGDVVHGTGVLSDSREVHFDISFVPSVDQIGEVPTLVKEQTLTAQDPFAGAEVTETAEKITTFDSQKNETGIVQQ